MTLKIRKAEKKDIAKILELKRASMGPVWEDSEIEYDEESLKKFIQSRFSKDRMMVVVQEDSDELLGFLHSNTFEGAVSSDKVREILTIVIHLDHYGEGIGGKLMEKERKDAKEKGVDIMKLETLSNNERALNFYREQDFSEKKKVMTKELNDEK
ncbi:MAG: GNAT family N-acetyltransferase [Candidatus Thermoplasmatota archaeon]|nr:GNAT family N-acetyltransferase [Candidatus Thermoplasmatota archaeon]